MNGFLKMLMLSPRLTIGLCMMLFGGIGGALSSKNEDEPKHKSAWAKSSSESYSAQARADDGWGGRTRTGNSSDRRGGSTYSEVWVDRDGVIHEKEDMKAIDPDAFN